MYKSKLRVYSHLRFTSFQHAMFALFALLYKYQQLNYIFKLYRKGITVYHSISCLLNELIAFVPVVCSIHLHYLLNQGRSMYISSHITFACRHRHIQFICRAFRLNYCQFVCPCVKVCEWIVFYAHNCMCTGIQINDYN